MAERSAARRREALIALLVAFLTLPLPPAKAGHELPYLPSYYPQEIRMEVVAPAAAARLLKTGALHAYIGASPFPVGKPPADVESVEFLGSYVIAALDGPTVAKADRDRRCDLVRRTLTLLAKSADDYAFHPYPVTPYHADYLHHFDLVEAQRRRHVDRAGRGRPAAQPRPRPKGRLAERLTMRSRARGAGWDVTIEEVDVAALLREHGTHVNGWVGAPWLKEGWFHAFLVLGPRIRDESVRQTAGALLRRLTRGEYAGLTERINLERRLVTLLLQGCEAAVVGYTTKREHFNTEFSKGIENVAFDAHTGLNSAVFIRTVKLKDFIWNGRLRLGVGDRPDAAWNPIGGFTDAFGRLVWSAIGDPAGLPGPYGGPWIPNRIRFQIAGHSGEIPEDALIPEPGTGRLRRVGKGKTARAKVVYTALVSSFHDGTTTGVADLIYPYVLAYRWGGTPSQAARAHDRHIERSTALIRERLRGFKVTRIDKVELKMSDLTLRWLNPVVEVYMDHGATDLDQMAFLAPPWTSVPWHVHALMNEAVTRGFAAFSAEEARARHVEWLDLVRRPALASRLLGLVDEFSRQGFVPETLRQFVTADEAKRRWVALKAFYTEHGYLLVTNGPYRIVRLSDTGVTLGVFRDLSYPRGIGSFDTYPIPHRGHITDLGVRDGRLRVRADVELVEKFQRMYAIMRVPLTDQLMPGALNKVRPVCRYVVVGPGGELVQAGAAPYASGGTFAADLRLEGSGVFRILAGVYVDDNYVNVAVREFRYRKP